MTRKKRYIILIDENFPSEVRNNITSFIKQKGFGYWHWIGNVWLITVNEEWTSKKLRDEIKQFISNDGLLVVLNSSHSQGWATFGNSRKSEWLRHNWNNGKT
ncbi:hypothetical protein [Bibersteinia trehalosi]|uniref:hypothetical protein n=1 Tax=Bibersteinia trehalosi TaxID=47735 RepID=UPI00046CC409|nr:hypothetical protein [Bibersteinia trehalosi]